MDRQGLGGSVKRIIIHWSAGSHRVSSLDRRHYHRVIDGDGAVHDGVFPIEANERPVKGQYAAHTLNCNTGSIGVALAAMAGAVERPFSAGSHPITKEQLTALAKLCAGLAKQYDIPVTRTTILTHAEVQPTLGIKQRGKWDITWLPHMDQPGDPVVVGDMLRESITRELVRQATTTVPTPPVVPKKPWFTALIEAIFGRKK
jgi:hypothetical protein